MSTHDDMAPADDSSAPERPRIFVTGATGYVGGRLVPALLAAGYPVRCFVREPRKLDERSWRSDPRFEIVKGDLGHAETLAHHMDGCAAAYYLVHSMEAGGKAYASRDRQRAEALASADAAARVARIIYLG